MRSEHQTPAGILITRLGLCSAQHGVIGLALLTLIGCRQVPVSSDTGQSSFAFVEPPPAAPVAANATVPEEPKSQEQYQEAIPIWPLAVPLYPAKALAAKVGLTVVGVHVTVDREGRVSDVGPSLLAASIPTRFDAEFQAAVRAALAQWRFRPAQTCHIEVVAMPDGGSYQRVTDQQNVETAFDLAFTFTATRAVLGGVPGK